MMFSSLTPSIVLILIALAAVAPAHGASIYFSTGSNVDVVVNPADIPTTINLELVADFTGQPSIGGGIDLLAGGAVSIVSFSPSAWFNSLDASFSGFGTALADGDLEIHFGSFSGFSGVNSLGEVNLNVLAVGSGSVSLAINTAFGVFFDLDGGVIDVGLQGTTVAVSAVPLPATAWLLMTGVAGLLGRSWRRHLAT